MNIILSPAQILIVGLVAIVVAWLASLLIEKAIPWILAKFHKTVTIDLGKFVKTILVGVAAFVLTWWWYPATLPVLPVFSGTFMVMIGQFIAWLPILGAALSPYMGSAMTVYNLLMNYVLDPEKRQAIFKTLLDWLTKWAGVQQSPVVPPPTAIPPAPPVG
jgi:hypothetical protein